jgi:hypothetical protein
MYNIIHLYFYTWRTIEIGKNMINDGSEYHSSFQLLLEEVI